MFASASPAIRTCLAAAFVLFISCPSLLAQAARVSGQISDETGGVLPGAEVRVQGADGNEHVALSDATGRYALEGVPPGRAVVTVTMLNFGTARRDVQIPSSGTLAVDVVLHYALSADVLVSGRSSFVNLADVADPAENLVGIAQSASQGAITAAQLDSRPMSRAGEVLETVPGVIVSQHSGEGKANQYYLRGFNLDHGTDFATTVAGIPANMPSHGHGQGYTDLNFVIPELVSGVQYSKGPYYAEQGDFATAGAANITYASTLVRPLVSVTGGGDAFGRTLAAGSTALGASTLLGAGEAVYSDGPWVRPDAFRKLNVVGRYSRGDALSGLAVTAMAYDARWSSTDQIPWRAVDEGLIDRFGHVDESDGGSTSRYSLSAEWQRTSTRSVTRVSAYGLRYRLALFSNFTYYLDHPDAGDQFEQSDRRFTAGARVTHRRLGRWGDRAVQNLFGLQVRSDNVSLGLEHTVRRSVTDPVRLDDVLESSVAGFAENSVEWTPWLRSVAGIRFDGYRFDVNALTDPRNGGKVASGIASPKGGIAIGPFKGTDFYANAGTGFHSNDARGTTIRFDPVSGDPVDPVTPLARAYGAEAGVRTVAVPRLQSTLAVWLLNLSSELVFIGDAGTTEAGRPSHRAGVEFANYYRPRGWLTIDGDVAWSQARFTDPAPEGDAIPGAVQTVVSAGVTIDPRRGVYGSARLRYFGPRPLIEDDSVRSQATTMVNGELGYRWSERMRVSLEGFNLFNAADSDIDYYYTSRLPGEPADGIDDVHFHPVLPRTFRVALTVGL